MMLAVLLAMVLAQAPQVGQVKVHGIAQDTADTPVAGVKFEFLLTGNPKRETAVTGEDGKYSLALPAGQYEIILNMPDPKVPPRSASAWLKGRDEFTINARVPKEKFEGQLEYDFLGEWRVVDERGKGVPSAQVRIETVDRVGHRAKFPIYIPVDEGEKEVEGQVQTAPDGRFVFRIREAFLTPDQIVELVATVDAPGFQPHSEHVYPVLQFSETGHLFEAYPDEFVIHIKRK